MSWALIVSIIVFLAAPLLARAAQRVPRLKSILDGFVLMSVIGIVTLTLLPEALAHGGILALGLAVIGFAAPWIAERLFQKTEEQTHRLLLLFASMALMIHTMSDGAILSYARGTIDAAYIEVGIVLHRVGIAMTVWWLLSPVISTRTGLFVMVGLAATTLIGYSMANYAGSFYNLPLMGYWQAFAAGSFLHVVLHPLNHCQSMQAKTVRNAHRIGTLLGLVFVVALAFSHLSPVGHQPFADDSAQHFEMVALLLEGGHHYAPLCLLFLAVIVVFGQLGIGPKRSLFDALSFATPWSLVLWAGVSLAHTWLGVTVTPDLHDGLSFYIYLGLVVGMLLFTGAPRFFGSIFPALKHHHHHAHQH